MLRTATFEFSGEEKSFPVSLISSIDHARLLVRASFWRATLPSSFLLKYRDADGDLITVDSSSDWAEMLHHLPGSAPLRILILPRAQAVSSSATATWTTATTAATAAPAPAAVASASSIEVVTAGSRFRQRWTLRNSGSAAWPQGCRMMHQRGERFGSFPMFMVASLAPGQSVSLEVNFTAPKDIGIFESEWALFTPSSQPLGNRVRFTIATAPAPPKPAVFPGLTPGEHYSVFPGLYAVPSSSAAAAAAAAAASSASAGCQLATPSWSPVRVVAGARVNRRWKIRNSSATAWPEGMRARRETGQHSFGFLDSFALPALAAGAETAVDLGLTVPSNASGLVDATWKIRFPDNRLVADQSFHLTLDVAAAATNQQTAPRSPCSTTSAATVPSSPSSPAARHPLLDQISSMNEDELTKLFNAFVNL